MVFGVLVAKVSRDVLFVDAVLVPSPRLRQVSHTTSCPNIISHARFSGLRSYSPQLK